jgi:hypothetical protein
MVMVGRLTVRVWLEDGSLASGWYITIVDLQANRTIHENTNPSNPYSVDLPAGLYRIWIAWHDARFPAQYRDTRVDEGREQIEDFVYPVVKAEQPQPQYVMEIPKGTLRCRAYADSKEVSAVVEISGLGTWATPFEIKLNPGTYSLKAGYKTQTKQTTVSISAGQTIEVKFQFKEEEVKPKGILGARCFVLPGVGEVNAKVTVTPAIDGKTEFVTPFQVQVDPGTYTLRCMWQKYSDIKTVTVNPGDICVVDFRFVTEGEVVTIGGEVLQPTTPTTQTTVSTTTTPTISGGTDWMQALGGVLTNLIPYLPVIFIFVLFLALIGMVARIGK